MPSHIKMVIDILAKGLKVAEKGIEKNMEMITIKQLNRLEFL